MSTYGADRTPEPESEALDKSQVFSYEVLKDGLALDLVKRTFDKYQIYRWNNHDRRWNSNDALYYGYIPQRFWEGTTVPRSSLGVPIVFDQVESALPAICNAIFQGSTQWFQVEPLPGTQLQEALQIQDHLTYLLEHPRDKFGSSARVELTLAIKDLLIHGNGLVMLEIDPETNLPTVHWVDIRDLYVDPGCGSILEEAKSVILRKFMSVEQLDSLRDHPDFKIPSVAILKDFAKLRTFDSSDRTKQISEWIRGVRFRPGWDDKSELPAEQTVEVLIYYSNTRIIWVLNRQLVCYNGDNPYGFMPFAGSPCFIIPGRWYAMGFADILESIQKYIQGITNGRLDELSLALNPPRAKKRGPNLTPSQSRWRPGLIMEFDKPNEDMIVHPVQNVTQSSWQEIQWLEAQAQKRTGMNDMMTQGQPLRSNASRTTLGVQSQLESPASRLQKIVETIESHLIIPLLYKLHAMTEKHATPGQTLPTLNANNQQYGQVSSETISKSVRFNMLASTRMLTRQKLAQMFPFIAQYLISAPFMQSLGQLGYTVDFMELSRMLQDATGTKQAYQLIRQISPQEQQARQQPSPDAQMKAQATQQQSQTRITAAQIKAATDRLKTQLEYGLKSHEIDEQSAQELLKMIQESLEPQQSSNPLEAGSGIANQMLGNQQ